MLRLLSGALVGCAVVVLLTTNPTPRVDRTALAVRQLDASNSVARQMLAAEADHRHEQTAGAAVLLLLLAATGVYWAERRLITR
jgi:hypothetical protein